MVFPVVMYGCENWAIQKSEHWRIGSFILWCWRRLLRVPRTARRSNLSTVEKISPECSLEGLMLKLKLNYFGHLMLRANSLESTLMLWKIEGRRRRGEQRMKWLDGIIESLDMSLSKLQEILKGREVWHAAVHGIINSHTWLGDWIKTSVFLWSVLNDACYNGRNRAVVLETAWSIVNHLLSFPLQKSLWTLVIDIYVDMIDIYVDVHPHGL